MFHHIVRALQAPTATEIATQLEKARVVPTQGPETIATEDKVLLFVRPGVSLGNGVSLAISWDGSPRRFRVSLGGQEQISGGTEVAAAFLAGFLAAQGVKFPG